MKKEKNKYIDHFLRQSLIFGPQTMTLMNRPVLEGNVENLKGHLLERMGSDNPERQGTYYFPGDRTFYPCKMADLKQKEADLKRDWTNHCSSKMNLGESRPKKMPPHLLERKERLSAQLTVIEREIRWLKEKIEEAQANSAKKKRPVRPEFWGAGRLLNNELIEFSGWTVSRNGDGIMKIDDPSSPYDQLPVWRVKANVVNIFHAEKRLREREEFEAARRENRPRQLVPLPPIPIYDPKTGKIEYPSYHKKVTDKVRKSE